jgi:hypothetical protein
LECRQKHRREKADDRDNDEELDEGEGGTPSDQ